MTEELGMRLGGLVRPAAGQPPPESPPTVAVVARRPSGATRLTLNAVSRRTGIPASTLRTWERRYGFVSPTRSASGYRLYGKEEIALVLEIKQLLDQGVRIGEAMVTVREQPRS
jgi:MerR family transcriptional regulator, light-induced transcriptional regulator